MTGDDAVLAVIEALEGLGVGYMLVGSLSSNFYGIPRATQDADFVIELGEVALDELRQRLGPAFHFDRQTTFETVSMTVRHVVQVPECNFKIELFRLSDADHDQERFRRRQRAQVLGREVWLPTAEDVVITKLYWAATRAPAKDRDDVRHVIAIQGDRLDWDYIHSWADRHGTRALLDEIRREIPPGV
ncbi:MAG TPA: hypothetical protein PK867_18135 [Pirellulales bacterium]|nr:hypothetical protein [Pirellulales bacterium]